MNSSSSASSAFSVFVGTGDDLGDQVGIVLYMVIDMSVAMITDMIIDMLTGQVFTGSPLEHGIAHWVHASSEL